MNCAVIVQNIASNDIEYVNLILCLFYVSEYGVQKLHNHHVLHDGPSACHANGNDHCTNGMSTGMSLHIRLQQ